MAAVDTFSSGGDRDDPVSGALAVTPHDTNELTYVSRALYVGVTGNLKVTMQNGDVVTFSNVPVGWHPLRVKIVWSAGTTATNIVSVR